MVSMRLVSLCPSLTELLHDLGATDEVVGRTKFCIHPASWVEGIERVGGTKNPKIERIIALAPDLVFMNEEENRREDAESLRAAGLAVHTSLPRTVGDTAAMVRSIASAIGRVASGEEIARDIEVRAERVRRAARRRPPVRYAYFIWRDPWMSVNDDTFVSAILQLAGGVNVFGAAIARYPTVTPAQLVHVNPDMVFLSSEPFPFSRAHAAELQAVTGFDEARFVFADGELLSWHGSRTREGIDYAERLLGERGEAAALHARKPSAEGDSSA
jgi:ABC-type Fe3+-hydroxamate transport system substrate-binding protein